MVSTKMFLWIHLPKATSTYKCITITSCRISNISGPDLTVLHSFKTNWTVLILRKSQYEQEPHSYFINIQPITAVVLSMNRSTSCADSLITSRAICIAIFSKGIERLTIRFGTAEQYFLATRVSMAVINLFIFLT